MGLRFQVLFHSPRRGSFHLSLTVLLHYRSYFVFSLGSWSTRFPTGFLVPRRTQVPPKESSSFRVRGFHPLCQAFPKPFRYNEVFLLRPLRADGPTTPPLKVVWAPPVSLAATSGIMRASQRLLFSFPWVLRWFSSPSLASVSYIFKYG